MEEQELRRIAQERVEFKRHLTVYVIVIAFLGIINLLQI